MGAAPVADAFVVAFRLPNHFRAIFGEGAFNVAFVPTYAALDAEGGAARAFADRVYTLMRGAGGAPGARPAADAGDRAGRSPPASPTSRTSSRSR